MKQVLLRPFGQASDRGMTLIEIIIVMGLVGGLTAFIISGVMTGSKTAKVHATEMSFGQIRSTMQMYKMHNARYPTTEQGLKALVENPGIPSWRGPYCEPELLKDAWGGDIQYESDGRKMKFLSAGDDEHVGTEDDVMWPQEQTTAAKE